MKYLVLVVAISLLLIPKYARPEGPDEYSSQEAFEFAFMIFDDFRITPEIGVVYQPVLREQLGIPTTSTKSESGTKDPTYRVDREVLAYEGLKVTISRGVDSAPSDWTWLERVQISDPKYVLRTGLRVGDPLELFVEKLKPRLDYRKSGSKQISYSASGYGEPGGVTHGAHATVTFVVDEHEIVQSVDIEYWAD